MSSIRVGVVLTSEAGSQPAHISKSPMSLCPVAGVPLIKRTVLGAAEAGLQKLYLVVGFEKEKIIAYVKSQQWPIEVDFINHSDWKKSSGVSLLAVRSTVQEDFVLMMPDVVFDPHGLKALVAQGLEGGLAVLAVDAKIQKVFARDDLIKVNHKDGQVIQVEKNLLRYNAVCSGVFLLSPRIFETLESMADQSDCSVFDALRVLLHQEETLRVFDIQQAYWHDIKTPSGLKHAEKILLKASGQRGSALSSRMIFRKISLAITSLLMNTKISANFLSFLSALIGLCGGYAAARGDGQGLLLSALLLNLSFVMGKVDGEIARLHLSSSSFGLWFNNFVNYVVVVVYVVALFARLYANGYEHIGVLSPFFVTGMALLGALVAVSYVKSRFGDRERRIVKLLRQRGAFVLGVLICALMEMPQLVLWCIGGLFHVAWLLFFKRLFLVRAT